MKISTELLKRCCSGNHLPTGDNDEHLLKVTHLFLQDQRIQKIENLNLCKSLVALYLYENKIETIENLEHLEQLSCLHLQENRITRIQNLDNLSRLTVLNLTRNAISIVEGLESLKELKELYIEYQKLENDQSLEFSNTSILAISDSLTNLRISGNNIKSLEPLKPLHRLQIFTAEENQLDDLQHLVDVVGGWKTLRSLRLNGNQVCRIPKYRDNMVVNCLDLEELDGKDIPQNHRDFLLNWRQQLELQGRKRESYALLRPFLEARMDRILRLVNWFQRVNLGFFTAGQYLVSVCCRNMYLAVTLCQQKRPEGSEGVTQHAQCGHCGRQYHIDETNESVTDESDTETEMDLSTDDQTDSTDDGVWVFFQPPSVKDASTQVDILPNEEMGSVNSSGESSEPMTIPVTSMSEHSAFATGGGGDTTDTESIAMHSAASQITVSKKRKTREVSGTDSVYQDVYHQYPLRSKRRN